MIDQRIQKTRCWGKEENLIGQPADWENGRLVPQNNHLIGVWMPGYFIDQEEPMRKKQSKGRLERERGSGQVKWKGFQSCKTSPRKWPAFGRRVLNSSVHRWVGTNSLSMNWSTWSNRQIWPWSTEWNRAKANRVLLRECTGHSKHSLPTTQKKTLHMENIRWSILKSDWLYSLQPKMEKLYIVSKNKIRSWLWLRSWTAYCQIHTETEESRENH